MNQPFLLYRIRVSAAIFALFWVAGCTGSGQQEDQLLARVNGEAVTVRDFQGTFQQLKAEQDEISLKNPRLQEQLKTRALNELVITTLLKQEANKRQIRIAREEVEGRLSNWKDGYPPGGFEEMLRRQNLTEDFLKKRIADQLLVEKLTENLFATETLVSDEEMKSYFNAHTNEFQLPERVHAFQIVVPTLEEAEKIRQEILANTITFESAARKYSLSPDAANGGDLGFFAKNEKIAAFNEAFSLPINTISKPIQSRYGVHLLKTVEKQTSKKLAFNDARNLIVKAMKKSKEVKVYKEWVTKLLKDCEVYRNEAAFRNLS